MASLSRPKLVFTLIVYVAIVIFTIVHFENAWIEYIESKDEISITDLNFVRRLELSKLEESLSYEKGLGCEIPKLDPFGIPIKEEKSDFQCDGEDWVECKSDKCKVKSKILEKMKKDVQCIYVDILFESDNNYTLGPRNFVTGEKEYQLKESDFVSVSCTGVAIWDSAQYYNEDFTTKRYWKGNKAGIRNISSNTNVQFTNDAYNVLILLIDSTSKNQFIREMPKTNRQLKKLGAVILNGYNIVGDGTPAALFPILTGRSEVEHPEARKRYSKNFLDEKSFLFYQLGQYGYRTAFYEDMPWIGTFQRRFNGFGRQPADHYLYPFMLEEYKDKIYAQPKKFHCVGDGTTHEFMMDLTWQFCEQEGKKFSLTLFVDLNHEETSKLSAADESFEDFLRYFDQNLSNNTMLILMGDHGRRYASIRDTYQGKLEERLPLMSIILPTRLNASRPEALTSLLENVDVLTTPFDIHSTILDILGLPHLRNPLKIPSSDFNRSLSLLKPISKKRTCGDAGVLAHWCSCMKWFPVPQTDAMYTRVALEFLNSLNELTDEARSKCAIRKLHSIEWVQRRSPNRAVLLFHNALDTDGYLGKFDKTNSITPSDQYFQVKIITTPGNGVFEGTIIYQFERDNFIVNDKEISRTSMYGNEPNCISARKPHLNKFCFCNDLL